MNPNNLKLLNNQTFINLWHKYCYEYISTRIISYWGKSFSGVRAFFEGQSLNYQRLRSTYTRKIRTAKKTTLREAFFPCYLLPIRSTKKEST
jgi:hypothetical protein